jgi:spermidine/putrescine transport system substrate-binding protein
MSRVREQFEAVRPRLASVTLAVVALAAVLAACGAGDDDADSVGNDSGVRVAKTGQLGGDLTISSSPGYIDEGPRDSRSSFRRQMGIEVRYVEEVDDDADFLADLQPELEESRSGGRDVLVVADWVAKRMYDLGYLEQFDPWSMPMVTDRLLPILRGRSLDPDRAFSVPWQSGLSGLVVNTRLAPGIRSVDDLFDPRYEGKVMLLSELRDTVPLVMKADGIDPAGASKQQWLDAIDKLGKAVDSGQIRGFGSGDRALADEDVVAAIGSSGDSTLVESPDLEWRMPTEGCVIWSDVMVIPKGAPNTPAALAWIDFVYRPKAQARIAAQVRRVSPVTGVRRVLEQQGRAALAADPLIFPTRRFTRRCVSRPDPPGSSEDREEVAAAFEDVVASSD